jgi:hypothetical protein
MQVQTSSTSQTFYPLTQEEKSMSSVSRQNKSLIQINVNTTPACICSPEEIKIDTDQVRTCSAQDLKGLFDQLKSVMNDFLSDVKEMLRQSLSDIKDIVSDVFGIDKPAGEEKAPVSDAPGVSDNPQNTPNALPWNDKALEYLNPGRTGMVTEGELQEALVTFQIYEKNIEAKRLFRQELADAKNSSSAVQGNIKSSLQKVVDAGLLSLEDAEKIYSVSHRAAQLDEAIGAISNVRRDGAMLSDAIRIGGDNLGKIRSGEIEYTRRSLS